MDNTTSAERKGLMGYVAHPPRCGNCDHFRTPERYPMPTKCSLGNFAVSPQGICKSWLGRNGETLADKSQS